MNLPSVQFLKKTMIFYLTSLIISGLVIFGISLIHKDTIVFFVDAKTSDFIQLYFPVNSMYTEEFSERKVYNGSSTRGVEFTIAGKNLDHVRVDPADKPLEIIVKRIEVRYLFNSKIFLPSELLDRIVPKQGIDSVTIGRAGLEIITSGNDPQFELSIHNQLSFREKTKPFTVILALSLVIYFTMLAFSVKNIHQLPKAIALIAVPTVISLVVSWSFYPGFMTFDTFHALDGARDEVTDSTWPPMISYIWRLIDVISQNPMVMHFAQVLLLLLSFFYIAQYFSKNFRYTFLLVIFYLSIPVILGTLAAIWKDVLMTSFLLASFATALAMKSTERKLPFIALSILTVALIFLGVASRHNAITAAIPLIFYLAWIISCRKSIKRAQTIITFLCLGILLTVGIYSAKIQLDRYSLPEFHKLKGATALIRVTRSMDIAGASICLNRNLFKEQSPHLTLEGISENYDPRHSNLSLDFINNVNFDNTLDQLWISTAITHPICFLYNKFQLTRQLIGAHDGNQFIIIAPEIEENTYGYSLPKSTIRENLVNYVIDYSSKSLLKPWFIYFVCLVLLTLLLFIGRINLELVIILLSATLYLGGLVAFGNAADARLLFYTTTLIILGGFIGITRLTRPINK
ncbi:hypothetical protein [Pseudomonas sp. ZS1P83]